MSRELLKRCRDVMNAGASCFVLRSEIEDYLAQPVHKKRLPKAATKHDAMILARSKLSYNAETGQFKWSNGKIAGYNHRDGYVYIESAGHKICAHRLAWFMYFDEIPNQIDHINMNRSDNRISNLRNSTIAENNRNRTKQSNNTSGYKGVTFHKATNKYHAKIMINKKRVSLGYFDTAEEASVAYQSASKELHGEYARH